MVVLVRAMPINFPSPKKRSKEEKVEQPATEQDRPSKLRRKTGAGHSVDGVSSPVRPSRPPLVRSTSSLVVLTAALDIFSRRPKEALFEEPPFDPEPVPAKPQERRVSMTGKKALPQLPSLLSLSSYIRRTSMEHVYDLDAPLSPTFASRPYSSYAASSSSHSNYAARRSEDAPALISPTASEFSDASSVATPTSALFPVAQVGADSAKVKAGGFDSAGQAFDHRTGEEEGSLVDVLFEGVKSPVLYEGRWGHGQTGLAF
ncbi:hypothetical protein JCM10213_000768 [Rhodosporidiobolus nylandii]